MANGLTGRGYIVLNSQHYNVPEYEDADDAKAAASVQAHQTGLSVVYAPVAVIRPQMDVHVSVPKHIARQLKAAFSDGEPAPAAAEVVIEKNEDA